MTSSRLYRKWAALYHSKSALCLLAGLWPDGSYLLTFMEAACFMLWNEETLLNTELAH